MKKIIILFLFVCFSGVIFSQNIFPSTGNVGIGTTNPQGPLHILNNNNLQSILLESNSAGWGSGMVFKNTATNGKIYGIYSGSFGAFQISDNNLGVNRLLISSNGNVGIGADAPTAKLDIRSSVDGQFMGLRIANMHNGSTNNPSASLSFSTGATANEMGQIAGYQEALNNGSNGALQFFTRQNEILNERMRIVSNGNVGLGTTAPRSKLDIWGGTLSITGADFNGTFVAGSQGSMVYIGNNALTNSIAIHPNGNVGIGTNDTKGYRFAVNGDAIFTKIKVKQYSTWPDYVFEKDYNLPSLAEVEKYIQQNKHLPEVQSSAQVEKDGLDLGDNQTVLLKKIEELTLYLIEQNKKLEEQQKRILLLEEKINNTKN